MSQIAQRAWRPAGTRHSCVATQRRFKTFERRVDKNNDIYYTVSKNRSVKDTDASAAGQQFFEMPNLLLDLDAEGTHNVRAFEDKDEELQEVKWRVNPKHEDVKLKLNDLEAALKESRRKVHEITSNTSNIWRLTSHDLVSAALHGPPSAELALTSDDACPDTLEGSHLVNALRRENGIPSHVSASDVLLLEWMLLRRYNTDRFKSTQESDVPDSISLVEAIQSQTSITGVRRLLLHKLRSRASLHAYFGAAGRIEPGSADVAGKVREVCVQILESAGVSTTQNLSCLAFLGSLLDRVTKIGMEPDRRLEALALRAASRSDSLVALSEWIHRVYTSGPWGKGPEVAEDAAACMRNCAENVADGSTTATQRQILLQLLTGLNEKETLSAESLRSIALDNLKELGDRDPTTAAELSKAYASMLGELGAVRTLLKEVESSSSAVQMACMAVLKSTPKYSETLKTQGVKELSLEECVSLDYHDIEERAPE